MVFSFLNPIYSQQKDFFNISISPNYSWFNRTDSKAEYIKQVPQLGGEIGLGLNYKLNQKISLEPGFSILCLRNKSISTVEGGDVKFSDGELFSRLNFRLTVFYALAINERIQGAISLGTAATFGAKLKSEFINPIHEYHTDTFRNWNQLFESGIGLYYLTKGERKTYLGLRASFGTRVITNKKVIHLNEENNFVNRNSHCSLVFQYYLK
jgi:DNA-directed RNA polymerase subunit E'/Rpb7